MAGGASSGDDDGILTDINVTPLVDVVLVLLIIFMITVPAMMASAPIKIDLPETTAAALQTEEMPMNFSIKKGEGNTVQIYLNGNLTDLQSVKKLIPAVKNDVAAMISADQTLSYGEVTRVIDALGALGLKKISLNTKHISPQ